MNKYLLFCFLILSSHNSFSKESGFPQDDPEFLAQSCREALAIFSSRDETQFLAAQRTSLTEAMRAGYCIGTLQSYARENEYYINLCRGEVRNWFKMAKFIVNSFFTQEENTLKTRDLLKRSFCD